jgi:MFS family permease
MFGVLGLANSVFHPADYSLLSEYVAPERITKAFSYHTCAGMVGSAIAPVTLLFMQGLWGWRGAFLGASLFGVIAALILLLQREPLGERRMLAPKPQHTAAADDKADGWKLLLSMPIVLNLVFFLVLSMVNGGLNQFLVVSLVALHATPLTLANTALTSLLAMSAIGVLVGGIVASRTLHHGVVAACGLLMTGAISAFMGLADPGALLLVVAAALCGFSTGIMLPSRDMIVRSVTPRGSFGKVFGFVSTGIHIGGIIAPIIFGQLLDHGQPRLVFIFIAAFAVIAVATVTFGSSRRAA